MPKISPAEMRGSFLCPNERNVGAVRAFLSSADKHQADATPSRYGAVVSVCGRG